MLLECFSHVAGSSTQLAQYCINVTSMPPNVARKLQKVSCRMSAESLKKNKQKTGTRISASQDFQPRAKFRSRAEFGVAKSCPPERYAMPNFGPVPNSALHVACDAEFWRRMLNLASHIKIRRRDHKSRAEFRRRGPSGRDQVGCASSRLDHSLKFYVICGGCASSRLIHSPFFAIFGRASCQIYSKKYEKIHKIGLFRTL